MKTVLMFIGVLIVLVIVSRMLINIIFSAVYEKSSKKLNKYTYEMKEKLARENAADFYSNLNDFDLTNTYRKLLKDDLRMKDLKKAAEIGCRLDMIEAILLGRGIELPKY